MTDASKPRRRKRRRAIGPGQGAAGPIVVDRVPDPFEPGAKREVARRLEILKHWHMRRQIDDAQRDAGEWLRLVHERAQLRSSSTVDFSQPFVDGRRVPEPLTDAMVRARATLALIAGVLGKRDYDLVTRVVCEGVRLEEEARRWPGREPARYIARRVRDALGTLAAWRGAKGRDRVPIRAERLG